MMRGPFVTKIRAAIILLFPFLIITCEKDLTPIKPQSEEKLVLSGQVVEKHNGNPVSGAVVKALKNQASDTTDSNGNFGLQGLSPGLDTIYVAVPAYLILKEVIEIKENMQPLTLSLAAVLTRLTLQNQTEHSGIMVELTELDTFTVTDSTGKFLFKNIADGQYILRAGYPYFAFAECSVMVQGGSIQTPVDIELQQLLQFWVEPHEITVSIDSLSTIVIYLWVKNITDTIVSIGGYFNPEVFKAIEPQGFNWPGDSIPNLCQRNYGTFVRSDLTGAPGYHFPSKATVGFSRLINMSAWPSCFQIGNYLLFAAYTDLSRFPKYFDKIYIWNEADPLQPSYESMNRSLYKKLVLFRPANLHVIP